MEAFDVARDPADLLASAEPAVEARRDREHGRDQMTRALLADRPGNQYGGGESAGDPAELGDALGVLPSPHQRHVLQTFLIIERRHDSPPRSGFPGRPRGPGVIGTGSRSIDRSSDRGRAWSGPCDREYGPPATRWPARDRFPGASLRRPSRGARS